MKFKMGDKVVIHDTVHGVRNGVIMSSIKAILTLVAVAFVAVAITEGAQSLINRSLIQNDKFKIGDCVFINDNRGTAEIGEVIKVGKYSYIIHTKTKKIQISKELAEATSILTDCE